MRDSAVPGLEEGQERLVEVNIKGPLESCMPWEMRAMMVKFRGLSLGSGSTEEQDCNRRFWRGADALISCKGCE